MKILLVSRMPPSLGGLETMGRMIALEWQRDPEIQLQILTDCAGEGVEGITSPILRNPPFREMVAAYRWADLVFFNHCYIKTSLPLFLVPRPYVVSMSGMIPAGTHIVNSMKTALLRRLLKKANSNIVACEAMRKENKVTAEIIVNPFDSSRYRRTSPLEGRPHDFIFAGRVHAIKGVFDMVRALARLRDEYGLKPTLSIAGDGTDRAKMLELADSLGLQSQIRYLGILQGEDLAREMNQHRCILVPSVYIEPIGICCLEGIACGCIAIGSNGGGLGQSVGPCGYTFPNGDVDALVNCMRRVLGLSSAEVLKFQEATHNHLQSYQPETVTRKYLEVCKSVIHETRR